MTLTVTLTPKEDAPDDDLVLFDMIEMSFMLRLRRAEPHPFAQLRTGLKSAGMLKSGRGLASPLRLNIDVPIRDGAIARGKAILHVSELPGGLVITSASSVKMNLQKVLRGRHRIPQDLVALNGDRNFSKPTVDCDQSDLEVQLEAIGRCVDTLRRAIIASLPGCIVAEEQMLLRKAEVCHDLACANADDVARATCRVPVAGSRYASQTEYPFTVEAGRSPTWHFSTCKRGPVRKGYAKRRTLLRTELSCPHRDAVVSCLGQRSAAGFDFDGVVMLALEFYHKAGEMCCEALDHVRAVSTSARPMHELLGELDGLRAIAERRRMPGAYTPSEGAARDAQRVLNAILGEGIVHSHGLRRGTKVRDELERLAAPGGLLVHGASPGVYCLSTAFGLALPSGQRDRAR